MHLYSNLNSGWPIPGELGRFLLRVLSHLRNGHCPARHIRMDLRHPTDLPRRWVYVESKTVSLLAHKLGNCDTSDDDSDLHICFGHMDAVGVQQSRVFGWNLWYINHNESVSRILSKHIFIYIFSCWLVFVRNRNAADSHLDGVCRLSAARSFTLWEILRSLQTEWSMGSSGSYTEKGIPFVLWRSRA